MVIQNLNFFDKFGQNLNLDWNSTSSQWEGTIFFDEISTYLYDNENIFILEQDGNDYKFPIIDPGNTLNFKWKDNNIEDELFLYEVEKDYDLDNYFINKKDSLSVSYSDLIPVSGGATIDISLPLQLNIAFNPTEEVKYERTLCIYVTNEATPNIETKVAEIKFYGEGLDEDQRFGVWARNFGIKFNKEDANILKDYDIKEAFPDFNQLNTARKGLLVNKEQVYPYIGTYKGLNNFINLLGYKGVLGVKEYWENINKKSAYFEKQFLVDITDYLDDGKIDNMNILDKNKNIKFGKQFKKTECLALVYQFTKPTDVYDDDGIPIIEETTDFTVDEIFYKMNRLRDKVESEFLPINVKIKDIIGEFIYFQKITVKFWKDDHKVFSHDLNEVTEVQCYPGDEVDFTIRSLNPLLRKEYLNGADFGSYILNDGFDNPYQSGQKYAHANISKIVKYIKEFYNEIKQQRYPNLGKRLLWEDGDGPEKVIGAACVFNIFKDKFTFHSFRGVTFDDLAGMGGYDPYYTLENIDFKNFHEITWNITKGGPRPYSFKWRGPIKYLHEIAHFLPYHGKYRVTAELHDFYGTTSVFSKFITVQSDQVPHITAITRLEDKFDYKLNNLKNVRLADFGTSPIYFPKINVLDNESAISELDINRNIMEYAWYYRNGYGTGQNMYDVEIFNESSSSYVKYNDPIQDHPKKLHWGLGEGNEPIRLQDFKDMEMKSLFFMRIADLIYVDDFNAGFYLRDPRPGKTIQISLFTPYVIPAFNTNEELITILNESNHPGIRLFNYEIINGRKSDDQYTVHAQAEYLSKEMYHILMDDGINSGSPSPKTSSPNSGLSDVDKYTFFLPREVYSDRLIRHLQSISPVFDDETLFLMAKTSDILSGAVQDPSFWVDKEYWKFNNDKQTGYLPTIMDQNSFNINDIKVFDSSFNIPENTPMFFSVNNIDGKLEYIWTLTNIDSGKEVVKVRSVPFFAWKFKDLGKYTIHVEVHDNNGNIYVNQINRMVNVILKDQYIKSIETRLDRRKHKLLN
jgi:hypothetical protein